MPSCITTLPDYICESCNPSEANKIRAVAFVKKGVVFADPTYQDSDEWATLVNAGDAWIINEVNGSYDGGSPNFQTGWGDAIEKLSGITHIANWMVQWTCENTEFFNNLNFQQDLEFFFVTENHLQYSGITANSFAKAEVTDDMNSVRTWAVETKWSNKNLPTCFDRPEIFASCAKLAEYLEANP